MAPALDVRNTLKLRPMMNELFVLTKERGVVRLGDVINHAQIALIEEVERQINTIGRVRICVVKARQMGLSTIIEGIIFCLSMLFSDFQSLILSHDKESAEHLLTMTQRYWTTYPFREFHTEKYAGRKQLAWADTQSNITIATANNKNAGTSKTIHALHASEVAKWEGNAQELIASLQPAIPFFGLTCVFYESTAKGIGNFFHSVCMEADKGNSDFALLFFPWWQHPEYTAEYLPPELVDRYALTELDDEEKKLRGMGITIARLVWRRWAIINICNNDLDTFKQEYPASLHEAFLSTGRNVFHLDNLLRHYQPMRPKTGFLERTTTGVRFVETPNGPLNIYVFPAKDKNWGVYQIGADPTHSLVGDFACAQVLHRRTLEQVATYRAHVDPREFGKQLALLGEFYNTATIAPEKQGPGYATIGFLTALGYPRIWETQKVDKMPGIHSEDTMGWSSNVATKHLAISYMVNALGQALQQVGATTYGFLIHDEATFTEMRDYVIDDRGSYANGAGSKFDDTVMALGIGLATHFIDPPVLPYARDTTATQQVREFRESVSKAVTVGPTIHEGVGPQGGVETFVEPDDPAWKDWE